MRTSGSPRQELRLRDFFCILPQLPVFCWTSSLLRLVTLKMVIIPTFTVLKGSLPRPNLGAAEYDCASTVVFLQAIVHGSEGIMYKTSWFEFGSSGETVELQSPTECLHESLNGVRFRLDFFWFRSSYSECDVNIRIEHARKKTILVSDTMTKPNAISKNPINRHFTPSVLPLTDIPHPCPRRSFYLIKRQTPNPLLLGNGRDPRERRRM